MFLLRHLHQLGMDVFAGFRFTCTFPKVCNLCTSFQFRSLWLFHIKLFYGLLIIQSNVWTILALETIYVVCIYILQYIFMFVLHWDVLGASLATSFAAWNKIGLYIPYIFTGDNHKDVWEGWQFMAWMNWKEHLILGISGIASSFMTRRFRLFYHPPR